MHVPFSFHLIRKQVRRLPTASSRRGQSLVEFALTVPLFLLLVFGVLDFGRLFFTQMTVQHAVRQAGRFAVTGRHLTDGQGTPLTRVNSIKQVVQQSAPSIQSGDIQISSVNGGTGSAGGPSDTMTISVTYRLQIITPLVAPFFPNGEYAFTARTTFKNEPFPPELTN